MQERRVGAVLKRVLRNLGALMLWLAVLTLISWCLYRYLVPLPSTP
jgi:hypothetical protein